MFWRRISRWARAEMVRVIWRRIAIPAAHRMPMSLGLHRVKVNGSRLTTSRPLGRRGDVLVRIIAAALPFDLDRCAFCG